MLQAIAILGKQRVISVENGGTVLVKAPFSGRSIGCSATKWVEEESKIAAGNYGSDSGEAGCDLCGLTSMGCRSH